jgi:predicted nucleic acid-binding protein
MLDSDKKDHDDVSLLFRALQDGLFRFLKSSEQKTMFTCKKRKRKAKSANTFLKDGPERVRLR